jgi:hypothetical protein
MSENPCGRASLAQREIRLQLKAWDEISWNPNGKRIHGMSPHVLRKLAGREDDKRLGY